MLLLHKTVSSMISEIRTNSIVSRTCGSTDLRTEQILGKPNRKANKEWYDANDNEKKGKSVVKSDSDEVTR